MTAFLDYVIAQRAALGLALAQHLMLVGAATAVAVGLGLPLGVLAARRPRLGAPLLSLASVGQTIPSLALLGFLLPLPLVGGVGPRAAIVALIVYGLLPVLRTTVAGLQSVDPAVRDAAETLGMRPRDILWRVDLPLALPSIVAGVRVAAVTGVGTATIAAAIGAGGLGDFIFRGLSMVSPVVILAGAVPAALLALVVDGLLASLAGALRPARRRRGRRAAALAAAGLLALAVLAAGVSRRADGAIVVGSKNFTEQVILGEMVAQALERFGGLAVDRRLNLGGTFICDRALAAGEIDVYVEYTGTALTAIFGQEVIRDREAVIERVRAAYAETGRTLLPPLGFNNTFAILVRSSDARTLSLSRISDLASVQGRFRAGFGYEFLERADGYPGLARAYGFRFAAPPRVMDLSLTYQALAGHQVDVIAGDATAGLIEALDLVMLEDDLGYFPPYDAVPVAHAATLLREPRVSAALAHLAGRIDEETMRRLNYAVEGERQAVSAVVRAFLDGLE